MRNLKEQGGIEQQAQVNVGNVCYFCFLSDQLAYGKRNNDPDGSIQLISAETLFTADKETCCFGEQALRNVASFETCLCKLSGCLELYVANGMLMIRYRAIPGIGTR